MKKRIALYGKGGIGKTTVAVNTALCMARRGYRVLLVGCDPKQDTTRLLTKQPLISILERYDGPCGPSLQDGLIANPRLNLWCCEAGGPKPGVGCAGRGIAIALNALEKAGWFDRVDVVLYDVLGDVVCGGFAVPIRQGYADEVVIVTSGEKMALYAAANIKAALDNFRERGYAKLRGIVLNCRNIPDEIPIVEEFAQRIGTEIIGVVPRDSNIQRAEEQNMTVVQMDPALPVSQTILGIARRIMTDVPEQGRAVV